jgi:hypothetical protein
MLSIAAHAAAEATPNDMDYQDRDVIVHATVRQLTCHNYSLDWQLTRISEMRR